jgi:hypothetical protein
MDPEDTILRLVYDKALQFHHAWLLFLVSVKLRVRRMTMRAWLPFFLG